MSTPRQVLVAAAVCLLAVPAAAADTEVHGEWWTPGFAARVRIEDCAGALCGRIVWLWDEAARAADGRPLVGRQVIDAMRADAPARWSGGQLHNPEDGRSYSGTLLLEAPHRLVVRGCIAFLCRSQVWRRFDAARSPPVGQITSLITAEATATAHSIRSSCCDRPLPICAARPARATRRCRAAHTSARRPINRPWARLTSAICFANAARS